MNNLQLKLKSINACDLAVFWAGGFNTLQGAWDVCPKSDWMMWIVDKMKWYDDATMKLLITKLAEHLYDSYPDPKSKLMLNVVLNYIDGKATGVDIYNAYRASRNIPFTDTSIDLDVSPIYFSFWLVNWADLSLKSRQPLSKEQADIIRSFIPTVKF
jgi:hypothetical protein